MATKKKASTPGRRPVAKKSVRKPTAKKAPAKGANAQPALLTPPGLGEYWPGQGGHYMGDILGLDGHPTRHIILPVDPLAAITGQYGPPPRLKAAESKRDGLTNTRAMAMAGSELAKKVLALEIDGQRNFCIASIDEAKIAYVNGKHLLPGVKYMWTSTQIEWFDAFAWLQHFDGGIQYSNHKSNEYRAFVVRSIDIQ